MLDAQMITRQWIDGLIAVLVEASARYLAMQAAAGAQALKIFESWAEQLPEPLFDRLVARPHARIVERLRELMRLPSLEAVFAELTEERDPAAVADCIVEAMSA